MNTNLHQEPDRAEVSQYKDTKKVGFPSQLVEQDHE